jgi:hypothetical protein
MRINKKPVAFLINYHPNNGFSSQIQESGTSETIEFPQEIFDGPR